MRPSVERQIRKLLTTATDDQLAALETARPDHAPLIADERRRRASGESPAPRGPEVAR